MPNKDESEKEAKISDSICSNCRNSKFRQSSHSGSNSSESSGYGGKQSTSDSSSKIVPTSEKQQEGNVKRAYNKLALLKCRPPEPIPMSEAKKIKDDNPERMDVTPSVSETELPHSSLPLAISMDQDPQPDEIRTQAPATEVVTLKSPELEGFSCAISMQDGVVIYTTQNLSAHLGFPKGMWIGRSFIDFLHPLDRDTFASHITSSLAIPTTANPAPMQREGSHLIDDQQNQMACRIRRYKSLCFGYAIKDSVVSYVPFLLRFSFKEIKDNKGNVYLIVKATPLHPAYNSPNECIVNRTPFTIRHSATGAVEYIDIQSVPYLGYLPQDIHNQDALKMYHPDDLPALKTAYETFVNDCVLAKSMPFRMMAQNGDYVKLETEWSSYTNPWTMKLEFVIGKHYVLEGPTSPDVFRAPPPAPVRSEQMSVEEKQKIDAVNENNENNLSILRGILTKTAKNVKQEVTQRVNNIIKIMEGILDDQKEAERVRAITPVTDNEQNSNILGSISPHHNSIDNMSSGGTSLSYTQLNYNDNLQRYFDSHLKNRRARTISPPLLLARDCNNVFIDQKSWANAVATIKSHLSQRASKYSNYSPDSSSLSSMTTDTSPSVSDFAPARLTEFMLIRHNSAMEKKLVNNHREGRSCNLNERVSDTNRQKTKEHLARCNATYQPTKAIDEDDAIPSHGLKRSVMDIENKVLAKKPCLQRASNNPSPPGTFNVGNAQPIYYPRAVTPIRSPSKKMAVEDLSQSYPAISQLHHQPTNMPWTCPLPVYGSPFMHPPMPLQLQKQHMKIAARIRATSAAPIDLRITEAATRMSQTKKADNTSFKGTEPEVKPEPRPVVQKNTEKSTGPSEEDRTDDGESSSSSFYSSFLRTESASMHSSEQKKQCLDVPKKAETAFYTYEPLSAVKNPQNKKDSSWMQVCGTRNVDFNYQLPMKSKQDTLDDNTKKIKLMTQSWLVNEQLGQLYKDLLLEGATARLTLEEGITSSSGESTVVMEPKPQSVFCKRNYSKLSLVYEENGTPRRRGKVQGVPSPCASVSPISPSPPPSEKDTSSGDADVSN